MMKMLFNLLKIYRDSDVPEDRLLFRNSIQELVGFGKELLELTNNIETKKQLGKNVETLQELMENYSLYPKLNGNGLNGESAMPIKEVPLFSTQF